MLKNEKNCWRYHHFTHEYQISQYDVQFLKYGLRQIEFFVIHYGPFFALLPAPSPPHTSLMIPKIKILKNKRKKCLEILSFYTYMCTISEDHMIYGSWNIRCNRQKFLSFQVIFSFQPLDNLENQNFNTEKNTWKYYHFISLHHMWQSYHVWYLRYRAQQT